MNEDVTKILAAIETGDAQAAQRLLPLVYDELRRLAAQRMARERAGQTLGATALVHEAYLRLVDQTRAPQWNSRGHFFGAAAEAMRRILIDRARHRHSFKAGGGREREPMLEDPILETSDSQLDLLALDEALTKFEREHPRKAALVKLRFFAGLSIADAAQALEISPSTADNDWAYARCWLRAEMDGAN